jgi:DNA-binding SARP family transcriptional activator
MARLLSRALEHGIEVDYVREVVKKRNLLPPEDAAAPDLWPYPLKLYTLGRFSLLVDDKPLKFTGKSQKKPLELLKALVAFGGREVNETRLAEALWPDAEGDTATQALATTLHRLRKLIGENTIERQEGRLSLDPRHVWVDAWAFERSLSELDQICQKNDAGKLQPLSTRFFTLYRGPFLKDEPDSPWLLTMRERLRAKFLRALESAARPRHRATCRVAVLRAHAGSLGPGATGRGARGI